MDLIQYTSEEALEEGHQQDRIALDEACKLLKKTKGQSKKELEAQVIQMEFNLRAKHREEEDMLQTYISEHGEESKVASRDMIPPPVNGLDQDEQEKAMIEAKKKKAKSKREKKLQKDADRELNKISIAESAGESARDAEMARILYQLSKERLVVKEIPSDGHCLYR